jgi:rare lipoprotein A
MKVGLSMCACVGLAFFVRAQNTPQSSPQPESTNAVAAPVAAAGGQPAVSPHSGKASWYGEENRGKLMANGQPFDPDKPTAASWFYPLGTRVRVSLKIDPRLLNPPPQRTVWVTITDRGPHRRFVRAGRIIDLSYRVFRQLADPEVGLVDVVVDPEPEPPELALRSPG